MSCLKDKIMISFFLFPRQRHCRPIKEQIWDNSGTTLHNIVGLNAGVPKCVVRKKKNVEDRTASRMGCLRRNEEGDSAAGQDGIIPGWTPVRRALNASILFRWESDGHLVRVSTARRKIGADVSGRPRSVKEYWNALPYPGLSDGHFNPSIARLRHPVRGFNQGIGFSVIIDLDDGGIYAF